MADVLLAGVLGAAVLAIVLLHRRYQRHEKIITQLRAELAAEKIARLTSTAAQSAPPDPEGIEPARRKRHLSLYIGGGVVAAVTALRGWLRHAWQHHRAVTVSATASAVAVAGTTAALIIPSGSHTPHPSGTRTTPPPAATPEEAPAPDAPGAPLTGPGNADAAAAAPLHKGSTSTGHPPPTPTTGPDETPDETPAETPDTPSPSPSPTPSDQSTPPAAPAPPTPTASPAPAQDPPASTPAPQQTPAAPRADGRRRSGICVTAGPILDVCLLGRR